jgi:putative hydrolase of the HAD superfamily
MTAVTAVVCDFGGVLTSPLLESFLAFERASGISLESQGQAMMAIAERTGLNPLFELETGRLREADFVAAMETELAQILGRRVEMTGFGAGFLEHLHPNTAMIDYMRTLRERGLRMAICTNNVREWEAGWRAKLPVDEIFEVVVDSAFVGVRKPDPEIYRLTLERLGVGAEETLFVDDIDINCDAARALGMRAVQFIDNDQAIGEIEAALTGTPPRTGARTDEARRVAGQEERGSVLRT